jgi:ankyrin repeat protein
LNLERIGQDFQFHVSNTPQPGFNFGQSGTAQIPSKYAAPSGQGFLSYVLLIAQFPHLRPDDVLLLGHAPISELDPIRIWMLIAPISEQQAHGNFAAADLHKRSHTIMKSCKSSIQPKSDYSLALHDKVTKILFPILGTALLLCFLLPSPALGQTVDDSLLEAAQSGDVQKVTAILDQKADINLKSSTGRTALMLAAMNGRAEVVKLLLDRGADIHLQDNKGQTAKQLAVELGQTDIVSLLDQAATARDPQLAFFAAVKKADTQAARRALDQGADVNTTVGLETTALMFAASKGDQDGHSLLKLLLEKGATVNAVNDDEQTAFDFADLPGNSTDVEAQQLLIENGAITNSSRASKLNDSLRDAVRNGDADKVSAALAAKADPNLFGKYSKNESVLITAVRSGNLEIVNLLLKHGANPNRGTFTGSSAEFLGATALFYAAGSGNAEIAKVLIDAGANVNVRTKGGFTPLMEAARSGSYEVAKLLIDRGANPNVKDSKERTALAVSSGGKRSEIQQLLIKAGANGETVEPPVFAAKVDTTVINAKANLPIDSKKFTKTAWKMAYYSRFPAGSIVTVVKFKAAFGEPGRTQTVEQEAYWYYECSDGTIQVVLNDPNLLGNGACIQSVNDF